MSLREQTAATGENDETTAASLITQRAVTDQNRQLDETRRNNLGSLKAEAAGLGQSAAMAERLRMEQQMLQQVQATGIPITDDLRAKIADIAKTYSEGKQAIEQYRLTQDLLFERSQMFRSPIEQQVASRLRDTGLGTDSMQAGMIRLNEVLNRVGDTSEQVFSGLLEGMQSGASGADILRGALGTVQSALNDVLAGIVKAGLMKGLGSAFGSAGFGSAGLPTMAQGGMGPDIPVQLHGGGMVGYDGMPRDLFRNPMRSNERLAVLERDEAVLTRAQQRALTRQPIMMGGGGGGRGERH